MSAPPSADRQSPESMLLPCLSYFQFGDNGKRILKQSVHISTMTAGYAKIVERFRLTFIDLLRYDEFGKYDWIFKEELG